jgi:phage baseplate assembly protein W
MPFQKEPIKNFIGRGITFPIKLEGGRPPLETGFELLKASIIDILKWPFGDRFMLNQYGSDIDSQLEEPNDFVTQQLVEHYVKDAIATWERRVEVVDIQFFKPTPVALHCVLKCRVKNSKDEFSFVFPFYDKIIY